jgi:hypothetical protein
MRNEFDRFIEKINVTPDNCWEWTAGRYRGGYGHFRKKVDGKWKMYKAHRFSYEWFKGKIPEGMLVCHSCDNPSCVNPEHLFVGTVKDNAQDCVKKGRNGFGRNPNHKHLSKEIADKIREDHKKGMSYKELQKKYDQSKAQISRVVLNQIWK